MPSQPPTGPTESPPTAPQPGPGVAGDFLAPLLQTLAESLDVREIFARISAEAKRIVPHDFLILGLLTEDRRHARVIALSGELPETESTASIPNSVRGAIEREEAFVLNDITLLGDDWSYTATRWMEESGTTERIEAKLQPLFQPLVARGMRSLLRVGVHLRGGVLGGLLFCSNDPRAFPRVEVVRARQIASCIALALAHQRLSEEEQRSAEARARADLLEQRVKRLTEELESQSRHRVIGQSKKWQDVLAQAGKVAPTEATVLLYGESGTGKEVVARFVHHASVRAEGPFVALNCAALPEQLLESELFGHEKGAFTGALSARAGRIEQAAGGVLFLDEVGEMSPAVQAKFLRVLQEREYQRVGGARTLRADVRVLAATNRDLPAAIAQGTFREDLFYRLAVFEIVLPPLRERPEDIDTLVDAFVEEIGASMGRPGCRVSAEAREKLASYRWPGNVRELRNAIERAVILSEGAMVTSEHLPVGVVAAKSPTTAAAGARGPASHPTLESSERAMIVDALARAGGNKSKAARLLGLTRAQLRSRLEKHGL
jgi:transcriptional regulator with GAF, ATPase, and Fis domain